MFTGIIRQTGKIAKIAKKENLTELTIEAPPIATKAKKGDSVAVDGACLTVTTPRRSPRTLHKTHFTVQAIPETLARTIIPHYRKGTEVNLETPLKLGDGLHGHLVQGHVDFVGTVRKIKAAGTQKKDNPLVLETTFPPAFAKFLALKGSLTINGVSLTISKIGSKTFEVSLIPETLSGTNLKLLKKDSKVNIEVDLIARYLDRLLRASLNKLN